MLWVKAFHLIAVICWFAALFYLPRLFVYHAQAEDDISKERFKIMERKLYRGIMTPSAIATVALGLWMLISGWAFYKAQVWIHIKLALVFMLLVYHGFCYVYMKDFATDRNHRSHVFFRVFNELPVLLLIAIVLLAIVKPQFGS